MRGDVVFRVYGVSSDRTDDVYLGTFRTCAEAEAEIVTLSAREMHGENWARCYHDRGFVIRETVVETDFEIPSLPKPRDAWAVRTSEISNGEGVMASTAVEVCRRGAHGLEPAASYVRNLALCRTFEPFRQGDRELALISRDYETTAVLDLVTGEVIAEEDEEDRGFCPVGFYVPDWWDIHDGRIIPGSEHWNPDSELPSGDFGFVWGCHWGDDTSWKLQHLDLSHVSEGIVIRSERFGYLELADHGWEPAWLDVDREHMAPASGAPPFLRVWIESGEARVGVGSELRFEVGSGELERRQLRCLMREENGPE